MSPSAPPIPPAVWERICRFLADGHTGQVILDVKDGRILAYKVTEWGRVQSPTPAQPATVVARKSQKG